MADDAETWYKNIIGTLRKAKRAMDPVDFANVKRIVGIFMPKAQERLNALHRAGKRVVHYTSAENLLRIITSKQLWMRNTNCMADYSEVTHGHSMLQKFFQGHRDGFGAVLHSCHPGLADEAIQLANNSRYGLTSAVITNDLQLAMRCALELESGSVHINGSTIHDEPHGPFSGVKDSGMGREGGQWSMDELTQLKWITIQRGEAHYPF